jgi:hypothetical protein
LRRLINDHMEDHMEAFALYSMPWDVLVFKQAWRSTSSSLRSRKRRREPIVCRALSRLYHSSLGSCSQPIRA